MNVKELEARLGHRFENPRLLDTALTHPSFGGDHHVPHYQRLEFLGDAVLELAVSRYLFMHYPNVQEGKLTFAHGEGIIPAPSERIHMELPRARTHWTPDPRPSTAGGDFASSSD